MTRDLDRRQVLLRLAGLAAWGGLASLAAVAPGCAPAEREVLDRELVAALRRCFGAAGPPSGALEPDGAPRAEALATLRGGDSELRLRAVAASDWLLRRWLRRRIDADLGSGRTRRSNGWLLAETEWAVAVLLSG